MSEKHFIGALGEDIAVKYIKNKGFSIKTRNYRKKWGEIDIIAEKGNIIHFIEVKAVSCENKPYFPNNVSRVTQDFHRPEDNIHPEKLKRLGRTIQSYLLETYLDEEPEWVFDAVAVVVDKEKKTARVKFLENLVI